MAASHRVAPRLPWGVHLLRAASVSAATRAIWLRSPRTLGSSSPPRSLSRSYAVAACQVLSAHRRQSTYTQLRTQMSMASFTRQQERHVAYHVPRGMGSAQCLLRRSKQIQHQTHIMPTSSFSLTTEASIHFAKPSTSMSSTSSISSPLLKNHLVTAAR